MFVHYRLSITKVLTDKQLSTLIKLSNESRYLVGVSLVLVYCKKLIILKHHYFHIITDHHIKVATKCPSKFNNPGYTK